MYSFSAQNFLKAANLKKSDERIWMALGDTFAELDNLDYAKKAYKRAISCGGANQLASIEKMARICQKLGLARKTAQYWELFLGESEGICCSIFGTEESCHFLNIEINGTISEIIKVTFDSAKYTYPARGTNTQTLL